MIFYFTIFSWCFQDMQSVFGSDFAFCASIPPSRKPSATTPPLQQIALKFYPFCLLYLLSQIFQSAWNVKNLDIPRGCNTFLATRKFSNCKFVSIFSHSVQVFKSATSLISRGAYYLLTAYQFLFKSKKDELLTHPLTLIICLVMTLSRYAFRV